MRRHVFAFLILVAGVARGQDRCAHATRNAFIGAGAGAAVVLSVTLRVPPSHEPDATRRISSTRALMQGWVASWGAVFGTLVAVAPRHECYPRWQGQRDADGRCASAAREGALPGAVAGGAQGFLLSPILALPLLLPTNLQTRRTVNLDHVMGLITAGGLVVGVPVGAIRAANECQRS